MELFGIIMSSLTAVIVAIIGGYFARKELKDAKIKKLEEKIKADKEQKLAADDAARDQKLSEIASGLSDVKQEVSNISTKQEDIEQELKKVNQLTRYNLEYTTEINSALINLSERIIDSESDDVLRKVMQEHRSKTDELQKKLFEITY